MLLLLTMTTLITTARLINSFVYVTAVIDTHTHTYTHTFTGKMINALVNTLPV